MSYTSRGYILLKKVGRKRGVWVFSPCPSFHPVGGATSCLHRHSIFRPFDWVITEQRRCFSYPNSTRHVPPGNDSPGSFVISIVAELIIEKSLQLFLCVVAQSVCLWPRPGSCRICLPSFCSLDSVSHCLWVIPTPAAVKPGLKCDRYSQFVWGKKMSVQDLVVTLMMWSVQQGWH